VSAQRDSAEEAPAARAVAPAPAPSAAAAPPGGLAARLLGIQRTAGNRAVGALLARQVAATHSLARNRDGEEFDWGGYDAATIPLIDWLSFYEFKPRRPPDPNAEGCSFNMWGGSSASFVADTFVAEAARAGRHYDPGAIRTQVKDHLRWRSGFSTESEIEWSNANQAAPGTIRPSSAGTVRSPTAPDAGGGGPQLTIGLQFNLTKHRDVQTGETSTDPPALQLSGQVTLPLHKDDEPGWELSAQASVSFGLARKDGRWEIAGEPSIDPNSIRVTGVTSAQGAAQAAWVLPLIKQTLQFQAFAQLVGGVNWDQVPAGGSASAGSPAVLTLRRDPMAQVAGGAQLVYTVPGTGKHLQLFTQVQASGTTSGQGRTADAQVGWGAQWQF
jgi:hypothetical protein